MENNNNFYVEGENMTLCHTSNAASTEFNVPPVKILMEEEFQPMDMDEETCLMTL